MTQPDRIQRQRTKGWRMPDNTVYVGRPTKWGNPFRPGKFRFLTGAKKGQLMDAQDAVTSYRNRIERVGGPEVIALIREELRGKNLCCWCRTDQPCHADVLLEIANTPEEAHA
ncbi:DUF4326 domain-containing protein [Nocardia otitidiscaviarum]|uniref:DUF4326 domain-containing protein n=1 Tax=Nocardia otitidiscaviarum TaxID=1823 RepID=UPI0004A6E38E|nr:DUF4326 domain-containing protein [Nocardia otitidiscaviarum]